MREVMDQRLAQRRTAALEYQRRFACGEGSGERMSLMHPRFNLREVAKQMLLLEDHLQHTYKHCPDCIRKHLMTIEAFAEEATTLDKVGIYHELAEGIANYARYWMEDFEDGKPLPEIAQRIRVVRKNLVPVVCDPRDAVTRVASRYIAASTPCIHRRLAPAQSKQASVSRRDMDMLKKLQAALPAEMERAPNGRDEGPKEAVRQAEDTLSMAQMIFEHGFDDFDAKMIQGFEKSLRKEARFLTARLKVWKARPAGERAVVTMLNRVADELKQGLASLPKQAALRLGKVGMALLQRAADGRDGELRLENGGRPSARGSYHQVGSKREIQAAIKMSKAGLFDLVSRTPLGATTLHVFRITDEGRARLMHG